MPLQASTKFLEEGPNIWKWNLELGVDVNEDLQMPNKHGQPFLNGIKKVGKRIEVNVLLPTFQISASTPDHEQKRAPQLIMRLEL